MVKFGKHLLAELVPEWSAQYVDYKKLKKILKANARAKAAQEEAHAAARRTRFRSNQLSNMFSMTKRRTAPYSSTQLDSQFEPCDPVVDLDEANRRREYRELLKFDEMSLPQMKGVARVTPTPSGVVPVGELLGENIRSAEIPSLLQALPKGFSSFFQSETLHSGELKFFTACNDEFRKVSKFFISRAKHFQKEMSLLKKHIRTMKHQTTPNPSLRAFLRRACRELYHGIQCLENFRILNYTAFVKIFKKHDKRSSWKRSSVVMGDIIKNSFFFASGTQEALVELVEENYIENFAEGNRKEGMSDLRQVADDPSQTVSFGVGFNFGLLLGLLGVIMYIMVTVDNGIEQREPFIVAFPIYRAMVFVMLFFLAWGVDVLIYRSRSINYDFILEVDKQTALRPDFVFYIASTWLVISVAVFLTFVVVIEYAPIKYPNIPTTVLFGTFFLIMCNPFPIILQHTRMFFLESCWRILITPFPEVRFMDFFLADQLTSATRILFDLNYGICFVVTASFVRNDVGDDAMCLGWTRISNWVLALLPFYFRFMQCIRRYYDTRDSHHMANAGKYFTAVVYSLFGLLYEEYKTDALYITTMMLAVASTIYAFTWDIIMDWSLLQKNKKNFYLREKTLFPIPCYWVSIFVNLVLRCTWIIAISPETIFPGVEINEGFLVFALGLSEIFRRGHWNIYRLENEHLNNVGKFRVVNNVPARIPKDLMGGIEKGNGGGAPRSNSVFDSPIPNLYKEPRESGTYAAVSPTLGRLNTYESSSPYLVATDLRKRALESPVSTASAQDRRRRVESDTVALESPVSNTSARDRRRRGESDSRVNVPLLSRDKRSYDAL